ncbi:amino acid ABC transporter membrane protein 1, PAAT family [Desulforhopalus singaporensis]|uniref:Amino acid ABC transporter membrane protein 1, PAAT family n=2 Tax=Desulforhopalus singaporensis TaxID=91360 RepID=A0A1H0RW82_9BACT|nr:amino acid ABC transporter membrane protein 1, PAAT family [Desulforhopalus singaporensis]
MQGLIDRKQSLYCSLFFGFGVITDRKSTNFCTATDSMADRYDRETDKTKRSMLNDTRVRGWVAQALVLAVIACVAGYAVYNVGQNLHKAGITTGFGFLNDPSGFDISQTLVSYSGESTYARALLVGLLNTMLVSVLGIIFATILGFFLGVIRLSPNWLVSKMAEAYTEIVRNVPLLLQILFWYLAILAPLPGPRQALNFNNWIYLCNRGMQIPRPVTEAGFGGVPIAFAIAVIFSIILVRWARLRQQKTGIRFPAYPVSFGVVVMLPLVVLLAAGVPVHWDVPALHGFNFRGGITILPELIALWLSLTLYSATFIGEYVRSGIMAVDKGQREATFALGYSPWLTYRLVIIPQAMRVVTPPLISQYLTLIKNSSLAVVIGYPDLVHVFAGTALNQSGQAVEIITITMAVYLTLSITISLFMNWYNKKFALRGF